VRVAAVVVAWNAADHLPACLAALDAQDHDDLEVVVVDNASTDGTAQVLNTTLRSATRHRCRVVVNGTNRGFAGAVNDALAVVDAEAVLLVNPDVVAASDVVSRCVAALESDAGRGSIQPRLHRGATGGRGPSSVDDGPGRVATVTDATGAPVIDTTGHVLTRARLLRNRGEGEGDHGQYETPGEVFGASGALVLHRRAMLDDVAWRHPDGRLEHLTEDLFAYYDDVELDWRARLRGWSAWYEPGAVAVHERGGAGPRRTATVEALNWANRLLVIATCDDRGSLVRSLPLVVSTTALKTFELALTVPAAVVPALRRLSLLPRCRARRRQLLHRATVPVASVPARWAVPFRWRPWIATWWRRVTGRGIGGRAD